MTPADWVQILKDVFTAAAAVTAATVAVVGLKTWKRQLRGNAEYDVARRLLRAVYKLRVSTTSLRRPMMWVEEMAAALKETGRAADDLKASRRAVYEVRMKAVLEAGAELEVAELEGEVLWGKDFKRSLEPLHQCMSRLAVAVSEFLRYGDMPELAESQRAIMEEYEQVVYDRGRPNEPDAFTKQLNDAIYQVETFIRPKLQL
jgi:hypothetical protein